MSSSSPAPPSTKQNRAFLPAKPSPFVLWLTQCLLKLDLGLNNKVNISEADLSVLRDIPAGSGIILTPNHADEVDPKVCMDLARRTGRQFCFMGNREAFTEYFGAAGWGLQRIGVFSVEGGGRDLPAKRFAVDVVKGARDVLVIFPEGEILYLNDTVQPFHSGAVDIGMQALIEQRAGRPDWNAFVVPLAIKYNYAEPMEKILEKRVSKMEHKLKEDRSGYAIHKRLALLLSEIVRKEEVAHKIQSQSDRFAQLTERISLVRHAILNRVEQEYPGSFNEQARTLDRAFQLGAHVREEMIHQANPEQQKEFQQDLSDLKEVLHMVSWQPHYLDADPNPDRMAEVVTKLEREIYGIKRPHQLAKREVYLRIGQPMSLASHLDDYLEDKRALRAKLSEHLRSTIQSLLNEIAVTLAARNQR